jgi:general stress protein YciG
MAIKDRGFASMPAHKRREISSKGGRASHAKGVAHEWTSEQAREAGHKGGTIAHQRTRHATAVAGRRIVRIDKGPGPN